MEVAALRFNLRLFWNKFFVVGEGNGDEHEVEDEGRHVIEEAKEGGGDEEEVKEGVVEIEEVEDERGIEIEEIVEERGDEEEVEDEGRHV